MPEIHVCALSRVPEVAARTGARALVTLINSGTPVTRPASIAADRHLHLHFNDIAEPQPGLVPPSALHVEALIAFARDWDREAPLLVHCFAGVSRSTAAAYVAACALAPLRDPAEIAAELRRASPTATPNPRVVALADSALGRKGAMIRAIHAIGRGEECLEGEPFALRP
ncbi:MAG: protein tyrosine phosphatase [Hyphomicrobiales bacterium]|nr:protein tyrosine phosphatase [Hyphomicrobiales bacterium]MDE2016156.1 protein tyrosine phosphatase [Hyphomicrobiales bacterium]